MVLLNKKQLLKKIEQKNSEILSNERKEMIVFAKKLSDKFKKSKSEIL